jgi:hypothetical protein
MELILVGYWSDDKGRWPDPGEFVDTTWDDQERDMVSQYIGAGTIARTFMGYSACRICGALNGDLEYTDGTYIWPQGLRHYVDQHSVRLPAEFVRHAIGRLDEIETANVDSSWWSAATIR